MILRVFCIRDSKAELADPLLVLAPTDAVAVRMFSSQVNDVHTKFGAHPEDFSLWYVGEFDQVKGEVIPATTPSEVQRAEFLVADRNERPVLSEVG